MMRKMKKNIAKGFILSMIVIPGIVFAGQIDQHYGTFDLKNDQSINVSFTASDKMIYQDYNFTINTLKADSGGDGSVCSWCNVTVTNQKKKWYGYSTIASKKITTTKAGNYGDYDLGNVGTGTFKHILKNNNVIKNKGIFRVNTKN